MVEPSFEDLESYLLNDNIEEWQDKPKVDPKFDELESVLEDISNFSSVFSQYFQNGKHSFLDLPIASNYELHLNLSETGQFIDLTYTWNSLREYEKPFRIIDTLKNGNKLSDYVQSSLFMNPISEEALEAILTEKQNLSGTTDISSAIQPEKSLK